MSDPYGTYPSAQASFYNSQAMMPHSGGRVAPQVPTSGDLASAYRTQQMMGMHGGMLRPGMSRIDAEQYYISQHYNNMAGSGNPFVTTARGVHSMLSTVSNVGAGIATYGMVMGAGKAITGNTFNSLQFLNSPTANKFFTNASLGNLASKATRYAATNPGMLSRGLSLGLRGAASLAAFPVTMAITAGLYGVGKALDRYDTRRQEMLGNQELFNAQNFSGSQLADIHGNMSVSARRDVNDIIANNTIDKYNNVRGMGFRAGELNSVATYAAQNNLLEGYTGSSSQVAGRIMSLAKVAKDIVKLGANITAGEAMELQRITTSMGIQNTELTSGNLGKKLLSAAKASNMSLMEMAGKASEAGAQYMSMGFSAAQGMKMSAHATIGAKSLVGAGLITGEELAGLGGSQGLENALIRSGTIAMQNNSQTMAMAAMKLRNGKLEVDHGILKDYYTGALSVDEMHIMAKRNMNSLMKADVNPQDRIKMLAQIQRDMPSMIKNLSSNMSAEQQMALAGQSILSMSKDAGSIGAAMDEYFGEDTQAREAFNKYATNFKGIRSAQNKLDRRVEVEKYKAALGAESEGFASQYLGYMGRGIEHSVDSISRYTIDPFIERSLRQEKIALETAAGYYGGEDPGTVLAMLEGTAGENSRPVDAANLAKYRSKLGSYTKIYGTPTMSSKGGTLFSGLLEDLEKAGHEQATFTNIRRGNALGEDLGGMTASVNDLNRIESVYDAARKRGLRMERTEDTGMISGDAGQDLLDRIQGSYYSDSTTNSIMNFFSPRMGADDTRESLVTMAKLGDMAVGGRNQILAANLQERIEKSAGSKDSTLYAKTREFKENTKKLLRELAGSNSHNVSRNQSFVDLIKNLEASASSLGISKEDMNVLVNSVVNQGMEEGTDGDLRRGSGLMREMQTDILNSFDLNKLVSGNAGVAEYEMRRSASIALVQKEVEGVVGLEKSMGKGNMRALFELAATTNKKEKQEELRNALRGDPAALRNFLKGKGILTENLTGPQLERVKALLGKVSEGKIDEKTLYGLSNIDLLMGEGLSAEQSLGTQKAGEDIQTVGNTLAGSNDENLQKLGQFLKPGEESDKILKDFSGKKHLTLESIVGGNVKFSDEKTDEFNKQLNRINELSEGTDKTSKLKQLLQDIATTAGATGVGSTKDAKNMEQVMDQISQGLSTFNTTMTTIANNISNNKPVEIKLTK